MTTRGLVLGKFLPPHAGHVYLCDVAVRMCDELTIVVASLAREPIAGELRLAWMRELMPSARVVALTDELPQEPGAHPRFWELWREALHRLCPHVDRLFAAESYGARLAAELGARWISVDPGRSVFPTSGTEVRRDPLASWGMLPRPVRAHYARRISVFGPESTGKSTLAAALAERLATVAVPECARAYLEAHGAPKPADMATIAEAQAAAEDALARDANRTLVCDTDPLLTVVWAEALFGEAAPRVHELARRSYAHTLLLDVDLPWVPDAVRYLPDERASFFARCEAALRGVGRRYTIIRGTGPARLAAALAAVEAL